MTQPIPHCPVCLTRAQILENVQGGVMVDCPRCGKIWLPMSGYIKHMSEALGNASTMPHARSRLSHLLRLLQDHRGTSAITIKSGIEDFQDWGLDKPMPSPAEQADNLILWIGQNQPSPSEWATDNIHAISSRIGTVINAKEADAGLMWIVKTLERKALLSFKSHPLTKAQTMYGTSSDVPTIDLQLTFDGWSHYETITKAHVESSTAFMAMKFDPEVMRVVDEHFKPAVTRTGFELRKLTDKQPAGLIDDQLRVSLRRAKFVIADLTHANNGAYWEAGFAEGLGRPVIYTCRAKEWKEEKTHFDTNHHLTVIWSPDDLDKACNELVNVIRATFPSEARQEDDA